MPKIIGINLYVAHKIQRRWKRESNRGPALGNWASSTTDGAPTGETNDSQNQVTDVSPGPGTLDTSYGNSGIGTASLGSEDVAYGMATLASGGTVVTGVASSKITIAEFNADGSVNTSFGTSGIVQTLVGSQSMGRAVAVLSSGDILAGGSKYLASTHVRSMLLIEYDSDGNQDTTFGSSGIVNTQIGASARIYAIDVLSSGDILVGGYGTDTASNQEMVLVEYHGDGSLDTTFGSGGIATKEIGSYSEINAMTVNSDGTILVGGYGTDTAGHQEMAIVKFNGDGSLDTAFGSGGIATQEVGTYSGINAIHVDSDGTVLAAGYGLNGGGHEEVAVIKLNGDGSLDTAFGSSGIVQTTAGTYSYGTSIAVDSAGTILVGGEGTGDYGDQQLALIAYNGDGSLDTSFGNGVIMLSQTGGSTGQAELLQSDGTLIVAGGVDTGGSEEFALARFNATDTVSEPLTYDNNGNTLTDENGLTYTYDAWNRMATATPPNSPVYGNTYHEDYYTYNALGERATTLDGIQSGTGPILIINDGNAQRSMIDSLTIVFPSSVTFSSGAFELSESGVGGLTISWSNPSGDGKVWVISLII